MHSADVEEDVKRGKMRRIDPDEPVSGDHSLLSDKPEKKPRKKWTMEETQMLVAGCNKVRIDPLSSGRGLNYVGAAAEYT